MLKALASYFNRKLPMFASIRPIHWFGQAILVDQIIIIQGVRP